MSQPQPIPPMSRRWLFSAKVDLLAFLGSAVVSLALLAVGWKLGLLSQDTPEWTWVTAILLIDVAHVYATGFRVYFDREELARRPFLYGGVPVLCFVAGIGLYELGSDVFWRALAYAAVFHFVRQQYGWVALYRSRCRETDRFGKIIDTAAIYLATIYPLVHWHAQLSEKHFHWFQADDFFTLPTIADSLLQPVYWASLAAYAIRSVRFWMTGRANPGKDVVVATTAVCWYVGIVGFNSDYAFTVTNVVIHGVPYLVLVWYWMIARQRENLPSLWRPFRGWQLVVFFLATVWLLAYVEELVWDRTVWGRRGWLFGSPLESGDWHGLIIPLLAVPQLTHYVLDGFIWRRKNNPAFLPRDSA